MENEEVYHCKGCERSIPLSKIKGKEVPECCGEPMTRMPMVLCTKPPASAEHARLGDDDGPCRAD